MGMISTGHSRNDEVSIGMISRNTFSLIFSPTGHSQNDKDLIVMKLTSL